LRLPRPHSSGKTTLYRHRFLEIRTRIGDAAMRSCSFSTPRALSPLVQSQLLHRMEGGSGRLATAFASKR
jgi:hypothetical protein